jgi:WD40 repeat protein
MPLSDLEIPSDSEVSAVAFSGDGASLAGACHDNRIRVWDPATGALRRTLPWNKDDRRFAFRPRSETFATVGSDGAVKISSWKDGEMAHRLPARNPPPGLIVFSPDGSLLASGEREHSVAVWDVATSKRLLLLPDGIGGAASLAFSHDNGVLAAANYDTDLRIWNVRTGALLRKIEELPVAMFAMSFSPDGRNLATAGVDRIVYLWDTRTWTVARKLTGQPEMISDMTFSPDGRTILTGGFDADAARNPVKVMLWDAMSGKLLRTMPASRRVQSVAFSPDSRAFAVANQEKMVRIWAV